MAVTTVPLRLLYSDGAETTDALSAKKYAKALLANNLKPEFPLPVWQVDDECYLVLHYGKGLFAGYKKLFELKEVSADEPVEVKIIDAVTIDDARTKAELPAPIKKTKIRTPGAHRRLSSDELRAFLEFLPQPTNQVGYQAGIAHALTFVVRGMEPSSPAWLDYTRDAMRKMRYAKLNNRKHSKRK